MTQELELDLFSISKIDQIIIVTMKTFGNNRKWFLLVPPQTVFLQPQPRGCSIFLLYIFDDAYSLMHFHFAGRLAWAIFIML